MKEIFEFSKKKDYLKCVISTIYCEKSKHNGGIHFSSNWSSIMEISSIIGLNALTIPYIK